MAPQIRAALFRSIAYAIVSFVGVFFGTGLISNEAADNVASSVTTTTSSSDPPGTTGPTPTSVPSPTQPVDDDPDTTTAQLIAAAAAALALVAGRGGVEGWWDTKRDEDGDIKPGDVGTLWVKISGKGDKYARVISSRRTSNTGKSQYHVVHGDADPEWIEQDRIDDFVYGVEPS